MASSLPRCTRLCIVLIAVLHGAASEAADLAPSRGHAIAVVEARSTGSGTGVVLLQNTGDLPLREVSVTWASAPASKATFDPATIRLLHPGDVRRITVTGINPGRALVTVGDKAGWARASRCLDAEARPSNAFGLRLTAVAPGAIAAGQPAELRFIAECPAADEVNALRPAARLVLSILLPSGVRIVDGEVHLQLDVPAAQGAGASRHPFAPVRIIAAQPGRFRVRAVVRDASGRAAAGILLDLHAQAQSRLPRPSPEERPEELPVQEIPVENGRAARDLGPPTSAVALKDALSWLATHQSPDGSWEAASFGHWCRGKLVKDPARWPGGRGNAAFDPGVTALAVIALAAFGDGAPLAASSPASRGLRHLLRIQDVEGFFGPRTQRRSIYNHALATLAMTEAYRLTKNATFQRSAQRALDLILVARNPDSAWRYGIQPGDNDTSVTGWMVLALNSARALNQAARRRAEVLPFTLDAEWAAGARAWIDRVTDPDYGTAGYVQRGTGPDRPEGLAVRFPRSKSGSATAIGVLVRLLTGEASSPSALTKLGVARCRRLLPTWDTSDGSIDMIYWHFGTLALRALGGEAWTDWRKALLTCALTSQRRDTTSCRYRGSWDPAGPWGAQGGRVYATALMAISLGLAQK